MQVNSALVSVVGGGPGGGSGSISKGGGSGAIGKPGESRRGRLGRHQKDGGHGGERVFI